MANKTKPEDWDIVDSTDYHTKRKALKRKWSAAAGTEVVGYGSVIGAPIAWKAGKKTNKYKAQIDALDEAWEMRKKELME